MTTASVEWPLPVVEPAAGGLCPNRIQNVGALVQRYVDEHRVAGVITVVARGGEMAYLDCRGYQDVASGTPMSPDAIFRIYSMTKPITCAAVLMLLAEGRFMLNWPVSHFIPEFAELKVGEKSADGSVTLRDPKRQVTIHDLLTHTAGLTYDNIHAMVDEGGQTLEAFVKRVCRTPLLGDPGEVWRYSESHDVLGYLVQVVSGQPFDVFLTERLFKPLGMTDTAFWVPPEKRSRFASIYTEGPNGQLIPATDRFASRNESPPTLPSGGSALVSTTADYLRFAQMLLNDGELDGVAVMNRKMIELMADNHLPPGHLPLDVNQRTYGLGVAVSGRPGEVRAMGSAGEFGWGGAAATNVWINPAEQMITLVMMQHRPTGRFQLSELIHQAVMGSLL